MAEPLKEMLAQLDALRERIGSMESFLSMPWERRGEDVYADDESIAEVYTGLLGADQAIADLIVAEHNAYPQMRDMLEQQHELLVHLAGMSNRKRGNKRRCLTCHASCGVDEEPPHLGNCIARAAVDLVADYEGARDG